MIHSALTDRVIAVLTKHGLTEQRMAKGMFNKEGGITADLTGKVPVIGMMINGKIQPEGNSNREIDEIQGEVEIIMIKSSPKSLSSVLDLSAPLKEEAKGSNPASGGISNAPELKKAEPKPNDDVMKGAIPSESKLGAGDIPVKKGTTTAKCTDCPNIFPTTISEAGELQDKYGKILCHACRKKAGTKIIKLPMCHICGFEVPHQEALECLENGEQARHKNCKENQKVPEQKEKIMDEKLPEIIKETEHKLTVNTIKQYLCPAATDAEAYNFLQLCVHRQLNPFLKEAYLIKYGSMPATMVVGKDAFIRKATESGQYDGFEAGIIIKTADGRIERRVGVVQYEGDILVGGWAKVFRKDMKYPFVCEVPLNEYMKYKDGKPQSSWAIMPGTMIRKVAVVQGHREAFAKELAGCYDAVEMGTQDNIK